MSVFGSTQVRAIRLQHPPRSKENHGSADQILAPIAHSKHSLHDAYSVCTHDRWLLELAFAETRAGQIPIFFLKTNISEDADGELPRAWISKVNPLKVDAEGLDLKG